MEIQGLQKTSLIDFPGEISAIFFLSKCNFRCPFCYNIELVENNKNLQSMNKKEIETFLDERKNFLDGIVITGGEPTLSEDLEDLIDLIRSKGFKVKLDTNGTNPEKLKKIIDSGKVDYIAMDIKASKENYDKAAGIKVNIKNIEKSVEILMNNSVPYEFRTTCVPGLMDDEEMEKLTKWIKGARKFAVQKFIAVDTCLNPEYRTKGSFSSKDMERLAEIARKNIKEVEIRE